MALPPTYKIRLNQKIQYTHDVVDFKFDLLEPNTIEFQAGQFVLIKIRHPQTGELLSRAYSLANPPHVFRDILLNIEILPTGKLTSLMNTWQEGEEFEMQGPFGHFTLKSGPEKDIIFVATGTGIAPLRSMIEDLLFKKDARTLKLYFGERTEQDIFYFDDFQKMAEQHSNFTFHYCLSRPEGDWEGFTGRVTAALDAASFDPEKTDFYLCGGKPMIDDAKQLLLKKGVEANQIYFEQYFL